ncbi:MAG: anti-sigma factor domain-containing protein [Saprospiraceae bacterium]
MDIRSFIQSGILESYALNQCSPEERAEVERMTAAHPEVQAELDAIEQTLEQVAFANAVPPPSGLKEHILKSLPNDVSGTAPVSGFRLLPAVLWVAVILLAAVVAWQAVQKNKTEQQVAALVKQVTDCEKQVEQHARVQQIVDLLRARDTRTIILSDATPGAENPKTATVWHNAALGKTLLDINSLPAPENGTYFQFWAIVDSKPVSMGMVNLSESDSWQSLPFVQNAQAFAISAENNPNGNPIPTVVVVVGKV